MVLCQLYWQNALPTKIPLTVSIGEAFPVNWSAKKKKIWGIFQKASWTFSLLCPAACPGQSFQLHWENQACFFTLLKPHSTDLDYKWKRWGRFYPTLEVLGFTAAMNLIALVAFPVRPTGTVVYWVTAHELLYESYLPPHCRVVKGFKNSNKLQLERGIYHCEIVCASTCTSWLLGPEWAQNGFGLSCRYAELLSQDLFLCWSMAISIPNPAGIFIP